MKERIAKTAIALFHEKGIKFTMSDLARDLGVSKSTLYEHFPSKDELIGYVVQQVNEETERRFREVIQDTNLTTPEKLKGILMIVPHDFQNSYVRLLVELRRYYPERWREMEQAINDEWDIITSLIEEGIHNSDFRPMHIPTLIQTLNFLMKSIFDQRNLASSQITVQESLSMMVDIILHGIMELNEAPIRYS
ncbi:TetR/AcrR family transcriptional regulator [Paenibacillus sp.]|jgi:AcrR family transcriptional regulator|uniref:TetR/AcrR family transcriptional regulator n=1 Tax=Paenibacillus sp. TaxID=58172 RepID=UPI0028205EDC|nr:TetR/AcrR family transcriptional regulator [Paenibacillus sp.]MDR0266891.1 TetR/AcrR family transcriptional regulator [Paenibacillus sp.]